MKEVPPNTAFKLKHYKGVKYEKEIIGVIDFVMEYPEFDSVYIGLLMIDKKFQGCGHGKRIIKNFEDEVKEKGFKRIRLGVLQDNRSGLVFWKNNEFKKIKGIISTIHPEKNGM